MKYKIGSVLLSMSVLLVVVVARAGTGSPGAAPTPPLRLAQASVTVPPVQPPVVVPAGLSPNTRGLLRTGQAALGVPSDDLRPELVDAYSLAVAVAPVRCHLPLSLLAAIGKVESDNLAGLTIDARHRVVPAVLGPVLDGGELAAIPDTDGGRWDGNRLWDRALGPMRLVPASWREVGLDMDGDGIRDPQDVYDAAGAAMVYLCADGRDLSTVGGLQTAVLAYNHSERYLRLVLAWKAAFDATEITGVQSPTLGLLAIPEPAPAVLAPSPLVQSPLVQSPLAASQPASSPKSPAAGTSVSRDPAPPAVADPAPGARTAAPPLQPTNGGVPAPPAPSPSVSGPGDSAPSTPAGVPTAPRPSPTAPPAAAGDGVDGVPAVPDPSVTPDPCLPAEEAAPGMSTPGVATALPEPLVPAPSAAPSAVPGEDTTGLPDPCAAASLPAVPTPTAPPVAP